MTQCIEWTGCCTHDGYGRRRIAGKLVLVHRQAYCDHHGIDLAAITGKLVLHTCDNPPCHNPHHLILGTDQTNTDDKVIKGRHATGETHGKAKLNAEDVRHIRLVWVKGAKGRPGNTLELSRKLGIARNTISAIVNGHYWKGVE